MIHRNFSDLKNPRFIIESGFKSRAGYNGARTVFGKVIPLTNFEPFSGLNYITFSYFAKVLKDI